MIKTMIKIGKFSYNLSRMYHAAEAALKLGKAADYEQTLLWIKKALKFGYTAMDIQDTAIKEEYRTRIADGISCMQELYRSILIAQMPKEDKELLQSVFKFWSNANIITIGISQTEQIISIFDIAKRRLASGEKVLRLLYDGDHAPTCLREIIQRFLAGDATKEETETELDKCTAILKKWIPEMFSDELISH